MPRRREPEPEPDYGGYGEESLGMGYEEPAPEPSRGRKKKVAAASDAEADMEPAPSRERTGGRDRGAGGGAGARNKSKSRNPGGGRMRGGGGGVEEEEPEFPARAPKARALDVSTMGEEDEPAAQTNRPQSHKFFQQNMWACRPIMTPLYIIMIFLLVSILFIALGAACLAASRSVVEIKFRYDDYCITQYIAQQKALGKWDNRLDENAVSTKEKVLLQNAYLPGAPYDGAFSCQLDLNVTKDMKQPIYMYYELTNFFQNHRRYVKSRYDAQLRGDDPAAVKMSTCQPELYARTKNGAPRVESNKVVPCGLIAWSYFNDTYNLGSYNRDGVEQLLSFTEKGIAWDSDIKKKYANVSAENYNLDATTRGGFTIADKTINEDQHFIVWMRTSHLPTFRKFYGVIELTGGLKAGDIVRLSVKNRFNNYRYGGHKSIVITTNSFLGGKNDFLGIAFLVYGAAALFFSIAFFALDRLHPRKVGDLSELSWNKKNE